ncbi:MAG: hypothetical protein C0501_00070 [Isosphaera sp.]|nr:hypothetical protein [Isosphaera sp.]
MARAGKWTDDTPVPPEVFDPLDGRAVDPPEAAPSPAGRDFQLVLKAYLGPDADPQKVGDKLVELYAALNDYSLDVFGKGLTIKEFEQFVGTGVLQPAGED